MSRNARVSNDTHRTFSKRRQSAAREILHPRVSHYRARGLASFPPSVGGDEVVCAMQLARRGGCLESLVAPQRASVYCFKHVSLSAVREHPRRIGSKRASRGLLCGLPPHSGDTWGVVRLEASRSDALRGTRTRVACALASGRDKIRLERVQARWRRAGWSMRIGSSVEQAEAEAPQRGEEGEGGGKIGRAHV